MTCCWTVSEKFLTRGFAQKLFQWQETVTHGHAAFTLKRLQSEVWPIDHIPGSIIRWTLRGADALHQNCQWIWSWVCSELQLSELTDQWRFSQSHWSQNSLKPSWMESAPLVVCLKLRHVKAKSFAVNNVAVKFALWPLCFRFHSRHESAQISLVQIDR